MMKRGISKINTIIILVVSLIILLSIEAPLLAKLLSKEKDERCAATAAVHKATKVGILGGDSSPVPIECPRTYISFYPDHLEIDQKKTPIAIADGNKKIIVDSYKALNSQVVFPVLAERMRICWKNFGEATGAVFDRKAVSYYNMCVFCAQIKIEGTKNQKSISLGGTTEGLFVDYLTQASMPFNDKKYYSYFTNNLKYNPFLFYTQQIEPGKNYYLVYHNIVGYDNAILSGSDDFHISILDEKQLMDNKNMLKCDVMYG